MNLFGGNIVITNLDDASRQFYFTDLSPSEIVTVDNSLQTVSSSSGLRILSKFGKKFLRLVPGVNRLRIAGNVASIAMTTVLISKKIGG
jgi:phage-related protein